MAARQSRGGRLACAGVVCAATVALVPITAATAASAAGSASPPTVTATVTSSSITFSAPVHPGTTDFKVVQGKGTHGLQLVQLHAGYSIQQALKDVNESFNGNAAAVRRFDANATLYGGASPTSAGPGYFDVTLPAGTYYAVDAGNGSAFTKLTVAGSAGSTAQPPRNSSVTAFSYGFSQTPTVLPHEGWTYFRNVSEQPHMLVLQQVKPGTSWHQVQAFANSMGKGQPGFLLQPSDQAGVISPGVAITWHYNLPAGKYLMACFWTDDTTGMPHFFMGMWKLVTLS